MQNDQFEQAVLLSLCGASNPQIKAEATAYCEQIRLSDNGWQLCAQRFVDIDSTGNDEDLVRFFCLHVIENALKTKLDSQPTEALMPINEVLMRWLQDKGPEVEAQTFVWNKFAYLFVLLFRRMYATHATQMMSELVELVASGRNRERMADMYLRVCASIHEEIVIRDVSRSEADCKLSVDLKDTMRDACVNMMVDAWAFILVQHQSNVALVTETLTVIGQYISWIDTGLIVNDRFIPLIFQFLSIPDLRIAACHCVGCLVIKGMNPDEKVELVQTLGLFETISRLAQQAAEDEDCMDELAKLVEQLGLVTIACLEKLEKAQKENNSYTVYTGVKTLTNDQMATAMERVWDQLGKCSSLMFVFLENDIDDITISVSAFAQAYLTTVLKPKIKRITEGEDFPESAAVIDQVNRYLTVITKKLRFDPDFNHDNEGEDEIFFRELRKILLTMFGNIALLLPDTVIHHVCTGVNAMLVTLSSSPHLIQYEDVEVGLLLLYSLLPNMVASTPGSGEVYGSDPPSHPVFVTVSQLIMSPVHKMGHKAVSLMYFDCISRYHKILEMNKDLIPYLFEAFFSDFGIGNSNAQVQSQACYRFSRVCAHLRRPLTNYCDEIIDSLLPLMAPDLPTLSSSPNQQKAKLGQSDKCWLYEGAAVLVYALKTNDETLRMLNKLCQPLLSVCSEIMQGQLYNNESEKAPVYSQILLDTVETLTRVAKSATKNSGSGAFWVAAYELFQPVCTLSHLQPKLRKELIKFSHRLVASIEEQILPEIPATLSLLLQTDNPEVIGESLTLLTQLMLTFKVKFKECMDLMLMGVLQSVFQCFNIPYEENDMDRAVLLLELKRQYYKMMGAITTNDLAPTLYAPANIGSLPALLSTILEGVRDSSDSTSQKMAITFFHTLSTHWLGLAPSDPISVKLAEAGVDFRQFVLDTVLPSIFAAILSPDFDFNDAQASLLLTNTVSAFLRDLEKRLGPDFHVYLGQAVLPSLNVTPQLAMGLALELEKKGSANQFRKNLRSFLKEARGMR